MRVAKSTWQVFIPSPVISYKTLCIITLLLIAFPVSGKAQTSASASCSLSFGTLTNVPTSAPVSCQDPLYPGDGVSNWKLANSSSSSNVFVFNGPSSAAGGSTLGLSVNFSPSSIGSYSATVNATYTGTKPDGCQVTLAVTINVDGAYAQSGFVNPKYVIIGVMYAPPGAQSSVTYGNNTVTGNSISAASYFADQVNYSVALTGGTNISGFSTGQTGTVSNSFTQEVDSASSVAITQTSSNTTSLSGVADPNGINHDYDYIFVWLNPVLQFSVGPGPNQVQWNGYGSDVSDPTSPDLDVIGIPVGCLNGHFTNSAWSTTCQDISSGPLARSWAQNNVDGSGPGLTTADLANILAADPFSSPGYTLTLAAGSNTTADGRFTACSNPQCSTTIDFEPDITTSYSQGYSVTASTSQTVNYAYSQTFALQSQFQGTDFGNNFASDLKTAGTLTSGYQFNQFTNNSQGQTASFTIVGPSPGYAGPLQFVVYQDNLYGTFMFSPQ